MTQGGEDGRVQEEGRGSRAERRCSSQKGGNDPENVVVIRTKTKNFLFGWVEEKQHEGNR